MQSSGLQLGGPALVPDMMYHILDIFNPSNARLLVATAAGAPPPVLPCAPCCLSVLPVMHPYCNPSMHSLMHQYNPSNGGPLHFLMTPALCTLSCIPSCNTSLHLYTVSGALALRRTRRKCSPSLTCSNQPAVHVCITRISKQDAQCWETCFHMLSCSCQFFTLPSGFPMAW